ncbi:MAG: PLD nuclease N-terminal domain-containing protein [Planctomycetaceae bacterium]
MSLCLLPAQGAPADPEVFFTVFFFIIWAMMMAFAVLISLAALGLMIWAIIDAVHNPHLTDNERLLWVLIIILVGLIGPVLYLLIGKNMKRQEPADHTAEPIFETRDEG